MNSWTLEGIKETFDKIGIKVTVIQAGPCRVIHRKEKNKHGYDAVQLGFGSRKEKRTTK